MSTQDSRSPIQSVLVVDDSRVQREHASALCRELGIDTIHQAANGREALALLGTLSPPPGVLVIDLEMPTMDGAQLLEQLGRLSVKQPILVVSSRERVLLDSIVDMGRAIGLHITQALQKPLTMEALNAAFDAASHGNTATQRAAVELSIDPAVLNDAIEHGQIGVHYQPKVDLRTGIVRGVEALARWQHPTLGMIPPDHFIGLAEQHSLIHPLTIAVMNQAMLQLAAWHARGLHLSLALNLSPRLLSCSTITEEICSLQQSHGLSTEHIVLEITETSLVAELGVALGVLARLRLRGFGLSLDDYGTGFSSMQQLARMPFTELKIDRSFIHHVHERENLRVILRSALEMAEKLGLTSVAEGVEDIEDWRLLQEYGCAQAQGYFIARPMSADDFGTWMRQYRHRTNALRSTVAAADRESR